MRPTDLLDDFDFDDNPFLEEYGEGEVVGKYFSSMEAEVAAARLRAEGVPCFLANHTVQSVMPHLQGIIRLHTRPADAALAREILGEAALNAAPLPTQKAFNLATVVLAIVIGVVLAALLVVSKYM
ncbi:MAG: DUF2007 domain-containing protein [Saprospiraceae bacterium]